MAERLRVDMCFEKKGRNSKGKAWSSFYHLIYLKIHTLSLSLYVFIIKPPYSPKCSNIIEARERPIMAYPVTTYSLIWEAVGMFGLGFCFPGYLKCTELEVLLLNPSSKDGATLSPESPVCPSTEQITVPPFSLLPSHEPSEGFPSGQTQQDGSPFLLHQMSLSQKTAFPQLTTNYN